MKNFLVRLAAFFALVFYSGNVLFASDYAQCLLNGQRNLDLYLERASLQTSRERFESLMEQGLEAAYCEWEQSALSLRMAGVDDWAMQRQEAFKAFESRADGVFCDWVMERKKAEAQDLQKSELYSELKKLSDDFAYEDSFGNESRVVGKDSIQDAKDQYEKKAREILEKHLLLNPSERAAYEAELIEIQAVNELANKLLYDHDSLKKMSDSQAALFVADSLACKIEIESEAAIESLFSSLKSQVDFVSSDDVKAREEAERSWLSRFEKELEIGLKKWSDAEEEFLLARSEWEREAENVYLEDSKKWQEAYDDLQNRKTAWSQKIESQIQEGKKEWSEKLRALSEEIDQYLFEFQSVLLWENDQRNQIIQAQEDAYGQCRSILASAQKGVEVWYERWGEKYKGMYSYWKTEDASFGERTDLSLVQTSYLKNEIMSWKNSFAKSLNDCYLKICRKKYDEMLLQDELKDFEPTLAYHPAAQCVVIHEPFEKMYPPLKCSKNSSADEIWDACQKIMQDKAYAQELPLEYWECVNDARTLWSAHTELFDWLDMFDEFKGKAGEALASLHSNTCENLEIYGELSCEKDKAAWLVDYWTDRVQIAAAVDDYAKNHFSDVESAAITERNLAAALEGYKKAKAEYQAAFDETMETRLEVYAERDRYFAAFAESEAFLERIEQERKAYDDSYQKKLSLLDGIANSSVISLVVDLQSMNYQGENFKKYLWNFCANAQEAFDKDAESKRKLIRDSVSRGNQDIEVEPGEKCFSGFSLEELEGLEKELLDGGDEDEAAVVNAEIKNRKAVLLLLDGSAESIHAFFDNNSGFSDIYSDYKDLSAALLQEAAGASLLALQGIIRCCPKDDLALYFSALDQAAKGASPFVMSALTLYKDLLSCRFECAAAESDLHPKLLECASMLGKVEYSSVNWFCEDCEDFFLQGLPYGLAAGYDKKDFERLSFGRRDLVLKIHEGLDFLINGVQEIKGIDSYLERQGDTIQSLQKEYEKRLDSVSLGENGAKTNAYILACDRYMERLENSQLNYDRLEEARRKYRLAQEIYFYAQNEYLHESYDPGQKLLSLKEALEQARRNLSALNSIEAETTSPLLEEYKAECLNYFKGRVMLYEYNERLSGQMERLCKAQEDERKAADLLVRECFANGGEPSLSPFASSMILASRDQNGNYSFTLNKALSEPSQENERLLRLYFSDLCVKQTDVYQNEFYSSQAKADALNFLESMAGKPYSLMDLAFCALHLKALGNGEQKAAWYKSGEDPALNDNYKIGDLPDTVHGLDVASLYHDERLAAISGAYNKVLSMGGEDDIAKFILFFDQNFSDGLDLERSARNALIAQALEEPMDEVDFEYRKFKCEGSALVSSAMLLYLIAALPFGWGAWAIAPAAAALAAGTALLLVSNQFYEYWEDMESVRDGCKSNLEECEARLKERLGRWQDAKKKCDEEKRSLCVLLSGNEALSGQKMAWSDFESALRAAFDAGALGVDSSYFLSIRDDAAAFGDLRSFFESLSAKEDFYDVASVMERMSEVLQGNCGQKKDALELFMAERDGDLSLDKAAFYKNLLSFYANELLPSLPVALNRKTEGYMAEAFGLYNSLAKEAMDYSDKNLFERERAARSFIYADMDEQRGLWEEKNQIILDTAELDWAAAQEQVSERRNAWQKDYSNSYSDSIEKWKKNYMDFLAEKENWIFRQYLYGSCDAEPSYVLVERSKPFFDSEGKNASFLDEICDLEKFSVLSSLCQKITDAAQSESCVQTFFEMAGSSLVKDFAATARLKADLQKSCQEAASKLALQQSRARLEKEAAAALDSIKEKNKSVEDWELDMVRQAGYTVDPLIHRNAVVDVSALMTERERQSVHRYEWFSAEAPKIDLEDSSYKGSGDFILMKKIDEAQKKLREWSDGIFGSPSSPQSGGRLAEHIGKAPVFVQNIDPTESRDSNVKDFGSGEMGKIILDYQWNSIVSAAASAEFSKAIYDQKLMDIGGFSLPSIRDIVGIVLDIVSKVPPLYALQYADDALFGAIDVGRGYKSWEEIAEGFLKQGIMSGIGKGLNYVASAAGKALKGASTFFKGGAGGQILGGFQKAASGYLNNVASNYAAAFDFASGKMDWERAASSWLDAGAITSAAGSFLGQGLGALNNLDANGLALSSNVFGDIQKMNSTIGSLAGQALNYALTGNFTVNLLSVNGVGLLEVGVSDGNFRAAAGQGGADLSAQSLLSFANGMKAAQRVSDLKKSGLEDRTLLNVSNLLALSGGKDNIALASDLFSQKKALLYESSGDQPFGKSVDSSIVLSSSLLSQGVEGQAMIAAMASLQNLSAKDPSASLEGIDFSKLKKSDGSAFSEGEILKMKEKLKTDSTLSSMAQVSSVLTAASSALGFGLDGVQNKNSLAALASAYKQNGMAGVYAIYADVQEQAKAGENGEQKLGLAQLVEQPWFQNVAENRGVLLGESLSMEEYNKLAKDNAVDRYVAQELKEYCQKNNDSVTEADIKSFEKSARAKAEAEIVEGVANPKYGYEPESYNTDLKNYGCTLATAAYIAYSITGNVGTLSQANEILKGQDLFVYGTDKNGVTQKNCLTHGDAYVNAVNAIAGGDYLKKDGKDFSVDADIAKGGKLVDNRQSIFDRLVKSSRDESEVYFTHMRVNGSHSVLFDSMTYTDEKNYKSSTLSVMDPWQGGDYGPKSWSDISRADFYKLSQAGKELYELTRAALRAAA